VFRFLPKDRRGVPTMLTVAAVMVLAVAAVVTIW
jgi:hypothetical protein